MPAKLSGKLAGKAGTEPQPVEMPMPGVSSFVVLNRTNPRCRRPRGGARATPPAGSQTVHKVNHAFGSGGITSLYLDVGDSAGWADGHGHNAQVATAFDMVARVGCRAGESSTRPTRWVVRMDSGFGTSTYDVRTDRLPSNFDAYVLRVILQDDHTLPTIRRPTGPDNEPPIAGVQQQPQPVVAVVVNGVRGR
jgi:hypothetical protein